MFRDSDAGARPGLFWRLAIVVVVAALGWRALAGVATAIFGPGYDRSRHVMLAVAVTPFAVTLVVLARRFLDRRPWSGFGVTPLRTAWRPFAVGGAGYLVPAGAATAAVTALGWVGISRTGTVAGTLGAVAGLALLVFLYEALPEELVFRGYVYRNLVTVLPRWGGVLAQAALFTLFGAAIGAATSVDRLVLFFAFGGAQGILRAVSGTVWVPVGFHVAFQTCEQFVGPMWNRFSVSDLALFQQVVLGLVPLGLGVLIISSVSRRQVTWREREDDPVPQTP